MINKTHVLQQSQTILDSFKKDLQGLRTGRASGALVEDLMVEYYGVPTPMIQIGSITTPESRQIVISPWDKKAIPAIEKAILKASHLGFNPVADNNIVRITIPLLTEERRRELSKIAKEKSETFKVEMRRLRDDLRTEVKDKEKRKEINEDERFNDFEIIDELIKDETQKLELILDNKVTEIMTI